MLAWLKLLGIHPNESLRRLRRLGWYKKQYRQLVGQSLTDGSKWKIEASYPCLLDVDDAGGVASGHYFHQDILVARRIFQQVPEKHVDVGSRVDGFVAHVAVFRSIEIFDIRPIKSNGLTNMTFTQADLMSLKDGLADYCDSLSCLHALEHFGLGRYGDPLDLHGHMRGFQNLGRILRTGGTMYLSVPVGRERIEFNAHRVFDPRTILDMASGSFDVVRFSYVDDQGDLHDDVGFDPAVIDLVGGLSYGCGIFEFRKR